MAQSIAQKAVVEQEREAEVEALRHRCADSMPGSGTSRPMDLTLRLSAMGSLLGNPGKIAPVQNAKNPPGTQPSGMLWSTRPGVSNASTLQTRRSGGRRCHAAVASSAMTSAIVRCSRKAQGSPTATSRAAVAASTRRQAPWAGKPITASRAWAQAPQVLQVASEYVAGQIAIRRPAGVYRGNEAVRSRHSLIVSAHSSRRLLNRCRTAFRA
jgi:hypothetical protein